jgi:glycosyltransferase involved in cell wall biosynthesis
MVWQALSPRFQRSVVNILVRERPDCCYFIGVHPANGPLCAAIRRRVRTPQGVPPRIAVHIHDPLPHPGPAWPLIFVAQQAMAHRADQVVVYGRALARQVVRWYGVSPRSVVVVRHGASRPPRREPPTSPRDCSLFSILGRIEGYKGLDVFLEAARQVHSRRPGVRFYIGGAGNLARYRRRLAELGPAVTVENRELSNEETDRVMQASCAVVLPYTSGTQSGVIPIAYWNGCPVITTSVGALPEGVMEDETGFVVPPHDPALVADRMEALFDRPELRDRMGRAAFAHYDRSFRWEDIANQLARAFADSDLNDLVLRAEEVSVPPAPR